MPAARKPLPEGAIGGKRKETRDANAEKLKATKVSGNKRVRVETEDEGSNGGDNDDDDDDAMYD
jgi:hypothetical protein